jgi:ankyrin repeat protein
MKKYFVVLVFSFITSIFVNAQQYELLQACIAEDVATIRKLIDRGVNINEYFEVNGQGLTPLMISISQQNTEIAKLLIDAGADINLRGYKGGSALIFAIVVNNLDTVKLLLDAKADLEIKDNNGYTALYYAVEAENLELTDLLIKAGANVNAVDNKGFSILMNAIRAKKTKSVNILLDANVDVNFKFGEHTTALLIAVMTGNTDIIRNLLNKRGRNITIEDKEFAILLANEENNIPAIELIYNSLVDNADTNLDYRKLMRDEYRKGSLFKIDFMSAVLRSVALNM